MKLKIVFGNGRIDRAIKKKVDRAVEVKGIRGRHRAAARQEIVGSRKATPADFESLADVIKPEPA